MRNSLLALLAVIITVPGIAAATTYHDYDYYRDEVRAGYKTIVIDKRGQRVKDNRGNCVLVGHLEAPSTEKRLHDLKYRKDCILQEPEAPAPVKLAEPAPKPQPIELLRRLRDYQIVFFDFDKDILTPKARETLDTLIALIGDAKDLLDIKLYGHADRFGSNKYNINLSRRRAENVKQYLLTNGGIQTSIISAEALGESQPVTVGCKGQKRTKETIDCLLADRRVEIIVDLVKEERRTLMPGEKLPEGANWQPPAEAKERFTV